MAILIFHDNTQKVVTHNQAGEINLIISGKKKPENSAQAAYIKKVKEIRFDKLPTQTVVRKVVDSSERKAKVRDIMKDKSLDGREKARKVAKVLKGEL